MGKSSLALRSPRDCYPISLLYPRTKNLGIPLAGKTELSSGQVDQHELPRLAGLLPMVTLYESPTKFCNSARGKLEDLAGRRRLELQDGPAARRRRVEAKGEVPATLNWMTIEFSPRGGTPFPPGSTAWR